MSGSCQFIALAAQLAGNPHHTDVRREVVQELRERPDAYTDFVEGPYDRYVSSMETNTTWGDNVTLQAAAEAFAVVITLDTDFADRATVVVRPQHNTPTQTARLMFTVEHHYA
jgi:hypothetical protein